jgi:hypothetical protein
MAGRPDRFYTLMNAPRARFDGQITRGTDVGGARLSSAGSREWLVLDDVTLSQSLKIGEVKLTSEGAVKRPTREALKPGSLTPLQ